MRWVHIDWRVRPCIDPAAQNMTAWKHKSMCAIVVKNGKLKVAVKRCSCYRLPIHLKTIRMLIAVGFDPYQSPLATTRPTASSLQGNSLA
jgi:hypothetical protein